MKKTVIKILCLGFGLAPWLSVVCVAVILVVVIAVVIFNCRKIAMGNPVEYLRNE